MPIDLSQLNTYYVVALPIIVGFLAGVIRQDKLPPIANEGITLSVIAILAGLQAWLSGNLGMNAITDFVVVAAYATALLHTPVLQQFQQSVQSHVLSLGPATLATPAMPPIAPQFVINASELAAQTVQQLDLAQLAALLKEELVKGSQAPAQDMAAMATRPALEVVRKPGTGGTGG